MCFWKISQDFGEFYVCNFAANLEQSDLGMFLTVSPRKKFTQVLKRARSGTAPTRSDLIFSRSKQALAKQEQKQEQQQEQNNVQTEMQTQHTQHTQVANTNGESLPKWELNSGGVTGL